MFNIKNQFPQIQYFSPNAWTLQDLINYIESQAPGFFTIYLTGPATRTIIGVSDANVQWSIARVVKRNDTLILCDIHNSTPSIPVYVLKKDGNGWMEAPEIRGGGVTLVHRFPLREVA